MTTVNQFVAEGILEGARRVLQRQLRRKFGELASEVEQRIAQAEQADLELWAERILEIESVEEVFGK